jgi:hypothetical protein
MKQFNKKSSAKELQVRRMNTMNLISPTRTVENIKYQLTDYELLSIVCRYNQSTYPKGHRSIAIPNLIRHPHCSIFLIYKWRNVHEGCKDQVKVYVHLSRHDYIQTIRTRNTNTKLTIKPDYPLKKFAV